MDPEFSPAVARADLTVGMSLVGSQPSPREHYHNNNVRTTYEQAPTLLTYHHPLTLAEREHVEDVVDRLHLPDLDVVPPQVGRS